MHPSIFDAHLRRCRPRIPKSLYCILARFVEHAWTIRCWLSQIFVIQVRECGTLGKPWTKPCDKICSRTVLYTSYTNKGLLLNLKVRALKTNNPNVLRTVVKLVILFGVPGGNFFWLQECKEAVEISTFLMIWGPSGCGALLLGRSFSRGAGGCLHWFDDFIKNDGGIPVKSWEKHSKNVRVRESWRLIDTIN